MKPIDERAIKATETTIADLKKYIEDMDAYIEVSKRLLEIDRQKLQESEAKIAQLKADIAAARLQAWYRENPGIELAVGDQLAVNAELCKRYSFLEMGEVYKVKEIGVTDNGNDYAMGSNGVHYFGAEINLARRMPASVVSAGGVEG